MLDMNTDMGKDLGIGNKPTSAFFEIQDTDTVTADLPIT